MKKLILLVTLASSLQFCTKSETETAVPITQSDFVTTSSIAKLTVATGIESFKVLRINASEMEVMASGTTSEVNGQELSLNMQKFVISKKGNSKKITSVFINGQPSSLETDSEKFTFTTDGKTFEIFNMKDIPSVLENAQQLKFFTLFSVLNDRTQADLGRLNSEQIKARKLYLTYTIGWGLTQTAANEDTDQGNAYYSQIYQNRGCTKIGRDSGCALGSLGCVTIDTWACSQP